MTLSPASHLDPEGTFFALSTITVHATRDFPSYEYYLISIQEIDGVCYNLRFADPRDALAQWDVIVNGDRLPEDERTPPSESPNYYEGVYSAFYPGF